VRLLHRADNIVSRLNLPDGHDVPERKVVLLDPLLLPRKAQQNTELVGLEASVGLELAASAGKLCPVESPADPGLERYLDAVAAKIGGAVKAPGREERLKVTPAR
jgi:hypothetical protein